MFKYLIFLFLINFVSSAKYQCNKQSALLILKRPTYEFSLKILDRVSQDTDGHFVFSPISTWLQLLTLSEGAHGKTLREIWNVTKHHRLKCFRRKWRVIFNDMDRRLLNVSQRKGFMVIDKLMGVKTRYVREVQRLKSMNVLLLDFDLPEKAAKAANERVLSVTNGEIPEAFTPDDFNSTVLLMTDTTYYKSDWKIPFNPAYTKREPFYAENGRVEGEVDIMERRDYFNITKIPSINAEILELPCGSEQRVSMLIFLPIRKSVRDLYYFLNRIRLMSIFNKFKNSNPKLVNLKMPKFNLNTYIDNIPELLYDMGVKRLFHPDLANLKGISDFKIYASLMTQVSEIDVNEKGVAASAVADFLVSDGVSEEFVLNRPFVFMLVDKITEVILFSGTYSSPNRL